jgi:hypothetical protein
MTTRQRREHHVAIGRKVEAEEADLDEIDRVGRRPDV